MNIEDGRNNLLAKTLREILKDRFSQPLESKSMVCLEGFSQDIFKKLKEIFSTGADIFWAGDEEGQAIVRMRNDTVSLKPLVVFTDEYFSESQSLAHFSRITGHLLLETEVYRKILLSHAFPGMENDRLLPEAIKKMVEIIQPRLVTLVDYLVESGRRAPEEEYVYIDMGKALWHLGLFSYKTLITGNKKKGEPSGSGELLKKSFNTYLSHNQVYSSAAFRNRFTYERIFGADIEEKEKKLLFNYARGENNEACYREIDFITVKKLLKRPRSDADKKSISKRSDETETDILTGIVKRFDRKGKYQCRFGDEESFEVVLEAIPWEDIFKPVEGFETWANSLHAALSSLPEKEDDPGNIQISVTSKEEDSRIEDFLLDWRQNEDENKKEDVNKKLCESSEKSNKESLKRAVNEFVKQNLGPVTPVTLHLDLESYIRSYLQLMKILWDNAGEWAQFDWFRELLENFVKLDMVEKDKNVEIMPSHPFRLFQKRLSEALLLELLEKEDIFGKEEGEVSIYERICNEVGLNYTKTWPRYFAWERMEQPLNFDMEDINPGYKFPKSYSSIKSSMVKNLNPQIKSYLSKNPLAKHAFQLKVLNPFKGEELFQALQKLFEQRKTPEVPESISLVVIGPNKSDTLDYFDRQAESRDKEQVEMFLRQPNRMHPFCRYEKQLKDENEWLTGWLDESPENVNKADICFAIDPFWEKYNVEDNYMPAEISTAIDRYFKDFEEGNLGLLYFLAGPDRIYVRLALEALSIMVIKRGAERRKYDEKNVFTDEYISLIEKMTANGEWTMVMDHNLNDYYAEQLTEELEKKIKQPVSCILQESARGVAYFFITPPKEPEYKISTDWMPDHIGGNKRFQWWLSNVYKNSIENEDYCKTFFATDRQWMIPLNQLPDWFIDLMSPPGDDEEELLSLNAPRYSIRMLFKEDPDGNIFYNVQLLEIHNEQLKVVPGNLNTSFLEIGNTAFNLFDHLRRKVFFKALHTLIVNPYQSWFLALLNRENVAIKKNSSLLYDNTSKNEEPSICKLEIWRLRRLTIHLIKLYSDRPGISTDERQKLMSLFDRLKKESPQFLRDCLEHLSGCRPQLFEENSFLKKFRDK